MVLEEQPECARAGGQKLISDYKVVVRQNQIDEVFSESGKEQT